MKIYNTLTKTKEDFIPLTPGEVRMYVCGPTVYNYIHIGNARPLVFFDTVRRYLEYQGYTVNYVQNYTDIDDRIIEKALSEKTDASVISARFIAECEKDMVALNVRPASTHPRATEEVAGMLDMIGTLIDKGHAYVASDGTVYYRTKSFPAYGQLWHQNLDDLRSGERALLVSGVEQKEDPLDFVLWKPMKEGEPFWESPWCKGRPGWHIECSVMSKKYLGEEIDIHAGGEDLIFPHHENEIAQSEGASGKPFARYWMHNAFLNIDSRKMSKSLGNFHTVREIGEKYDLQALRFFLLSAHYRSPLNFSEESMEAAKNGLERIRTCVANLVYIIENRAGTAGIAEQTNVAGEASLAPTGDTSAYTTQFVTAMDDDFNTADAIAAIFDLVKYANNVVNESATPLATLQALKAQITALCDICGLIVEKKPDILAADIEALIAERQAARKEKDFARADEIRNQLSGMGIVLEDTREGVKWRKET
jgi:cysteinyl-tRNA synthetase